MQEVRGSSPLISTTIQEELQGVARESWATSFACGAAKVQKLKKSLSMLVWLGVLAFLCIFCRQGWAQGSGVAGDWGVPLSSLKNPPQARTSAEKRILGVINDIRTGPWMANVDMLHGRLLRILTEATHAQRVVEIGTANGYSALWICLGLQTTGGKLITHEIDPGRAVLARENFKRAGVEDLVTVVEGDAHQTVTRLTEPIDILFLDADKAGYPDYLSKLLPLVRPGGLILADNVSRPSPSPQFIKAIITDPNLETVFLNMQSTGISLTVKKR
jgi:caffeoyl-CoA O-methyltransferase